MRPKHFLRKKKKYKGEWGEPSRVQAWKTRKREGHDCQSFRMQTTEKLTFPQEEEP